MNINEKTLVTAFFKTARKVSKLRDLVQEAPEKTESDHINISKSQNLELLPFSK